MTISKVFNGIHFNVPNRWKAIVAAHLVSFDSCSLYHTLITHTVAVHECSNWFHLICQGSERKVEKASIHPISVSNPHSSCAESINLYKQFRLLSNAWTINTIITQVWCLWYNSQILIVCQNIDLISLHLANTHPDNNNWISLKS